ncbi:MAG: hypothetical protein MN733_05330 [Nitrososphaera sp.]|nr:hypothetical protein [Nitrososphaera sp.]
MYRNSIDALFDAVGLEANKAKEDVKQGSIEISSTISFLRNGIKICVVQMVGKSGCCYRVEATGPEADELYREATNLRLQLESDPLRVDFRPINERFAPSIY